MGAAVQQKDAGGGRRRGRRRSRSAYGNQYHAVCGRDAGAAHTHGGSALDDRRSRGAAKDGGGRVVGDDEEPLTVTMTASGDDSDPNDAG